MSTEDQLDPPLERVGTSPRVAVVFGSASDWPTLRETVEVLKEFEVDCEYGVVSAHRTPNRMRDFATGAAERGIEIIVAGAGGAAHLPGMIAAWTQLPVVGVPVESRALKGMDSLLSIVQMPGGVPVATMSIGTAGARNAGLFALRFLAVRDERLRESLKSWKEAAADEALKKKLDR